MKDNIIFIGVVAAFATLLFGCVTRLRDDISMYVKTAQEAIVEAMEVDEPGEVEVTEPVVQTEVEKPVRDMIPEDSIYTFFQGPKAWKSRVDGSGEWAEMVLDGGSFGNFGCGFCCMANLYCTFTPYQCSPVDVYNYSREITYYEGGSAIAWGYLRQTLESIGFTCETGVKPESYEEFRDIVEDSLAVIALISSNDDDSYWQDTPGHYVTLLSYDDISEEIFLGDSGDLNHNRSWVPVETIYKALKSSSNRQYLAIKEYQDDNNQWRWNDITETWVAY